MSVSTKMSSPIFLSESQVQEALNWDDLVTCIEMAMSDVSAKNASPDTTVIQPPRGFMRMPHKKGVLLTMPGLSERSKTLSCKLVTSFLNNPEAHNMPTILATIAVFDSDTGRLQAVVEGTTITEWRTAAASIVATRHLKPKLQTDAGGSILAVLGAGCQGRAHILAFSHFYKFKRIHLWNRTLTNAELLAKELKLKHEIDVKVFSDVSSATAEADVIVTGTYASEPFLHLKDLKRGVLINAVGAGMNHHSELHPDIYAQSEIFTDCMENAKGELKGLFDQGFNMRGEVGEVINKQVEVSDSEVVVFQSLGMAVEDSVAAKLVLRKHQELQS